MFLQTNTVNTLKHRMLLMSLYTLTLTLTHTHTRTPPHAPLSLHLQASTVGGPTQYAKLLMLFRARVRRAGHLVDEEFACVRWYERQRVRADAVQCQRLHWRGVGIWPRRLPVCGAIPLSSILRAVDIQPDHTAGGLAPPVASGSVIGGFYVNRFRWS